jgi:hypothetical protein
VLCCTPPPPTRTQQPTHLLRRQLLGRGAGVGAAAQLADEAHRVLAADAVKLAREEGDQGRRLGVGDQALDELEVDAAGVVLRRLVFLFCFFLVLVSGVGF